MAVRLRPRPLPVADVAPRLLMVAHRGASADAPENTLAAIRLAAAQGADLVEVDVRRTRDGALVLLHDATLTRTTDARTRLPGAGPWKVADTDLPDLRDLDAGVWRGLPGERIPTLGEAVAASTLPLLVDVKAPDATLVRDLARALPRGRRVLVQAADVGAMRDLKAARPDVDVSVLGRPTGDALTEIATWADGVHVQHLRLDREYVGRLQDHGLRCLAWTVNGRRLLDRVHRLGVDGVITDRPAVARARAGQLGQPVGAWWPKGTSSV